MRCVDRVTLLLREFIEVLVVMKAEREQVLLLGDEDERNR